MRKSLVIGIGGYADKPLRNPIRDAQRVHDVMQKRGFDSTLVINPDVTTFSAELNNFSAKASGARFGLLYFAGHGMEVNGDGYVQPIDFPLPFSGHRLRHCGVSIADLLNALDPIEGPKILLIDACRVPFDSFEFDEWRATMEAIKDSKKQGIPRRNTFISYSTGAGQAALDGIGSNSIYCEEFCDGFLDHTLSVEECFKKIGVSVQKKTESRQQPWYYTSLADNVTFSDLPRYVPHAVIKPPAGRPGSILTLYGNESLEGIYLSDGDNVVWYVDDTKFQAVVRLNKGSILANALLPSGDIAIINADSQILLACEKKTFSFDTEVEAPNGFSWSASAGTFAVYGAEGFAIFKFNDNAPVVMFKKDMPSPIYCCNFLDEDTVLFGGMHAVACVSNLNQKPKFEYIISERHEHFYSISHVRPDNIIAVTTNAGRVYWYDISKSVLVSVTNLPETVQTTAAKRQSLLDIATDEVITKFLNSPEVLSTSVRDILQEKLTPNRLLFSSVTTDPNLLAVISNEGSVYIIDNRAKQLAQLISDPSGRALSGEGICFLSNRMLCFVTADLNVIFYRPVDPTY